MSHRGVSLQYESNSVKAPSLPPGLRINRQTLLGHAKPT